MKKYSVTRKYALKQYENIDLSVEGLESRDEIKKELEQLDEIVEEYKKEEEIVISPFPDRKGEKPKGMPTPPPF